MNKKTGASMDAPQPWLRKRSSAHWLLYNLVVTYSQQKPPLKPRLERKIVRTPKVKCYLRHDLHLTDRAYFPEALQSRVLATAKPSHQMSLLKSYPRPGDVLNFSIPRWGEPVPGIIP